MKRIVYIATSLDGFIADSKGSIEWLNSYPNPDKDDLGWSDFINEIDAIVMGKNTFEKVVSFKIGWPYPQKGYILSTSLKEVPAEFADKVEVIKGNPHEVTDLLCARDLGNIYIDGGTVIQQFLKEDMIDELIITRVPILLGAGVPLFSTLNSSLDFEHVKTEVLINQLVQTTYRRKK